MKIDFSETIPLKSGVTASYTDGVLAVKGPKGESKRVFRHPKMILTVEKEQITLKALKGTKREKTTIYTWSAHIVNMVEGVHQPYVYKLKICSSHFPMNVAVSGKELTVKNFLGEKTPRTLGIREGAIVKVAGEQITVESPDREKAGQTAAAIEQLVRISNKDRRVFQDGIYIIQAPGRRLEK